MEELKVHECFECGSNFTIQQEFEDEEQDVSFCPFCGSEMEYEADEDDDLPLPEYDD